MMLCICKSLLYKNLYALYLSIDYDISGVSVSVTSSSGSSPLLIGSTHTYAITCTATINCASTPCNADNITFAWTLNSAAIGSGFTGLDNSFMSDITNGTVNNTITTMGINVNHAGVYNCTASLSASVMPSSMSNTRTVQVKSKYSNVVSY